MLKIQKLGAALLLAAGTLATTFANASEGAAGYAYPIDNAYAATIIGTPNGYKAELPEYTDIPAKEYALKEPGKTDSIPDVFWYEKKGLKYTLTAQKHKAPLVFAIAGTGATHLSSKMKLFQRAFYNAGFHVVSINSPTVSNFMLNASETAIPGNLEEDAEDLYKVMKLIIEQHPELDVSQYDLIGYSLGASHAAFVARLDEQEKAFNFNKVMMINPPLNLYNSVQKLDRMLEDNIPGGMDNFNTYFRNLINNLTQYHKDNPDINLLSSDFLYSAYKDKDPGNYSMQALIGVAFRLSSANLIFVTDVANNLGYVVPKGTELTSTTSLTEYSKATRRLGFVDYVNEVYVPYFNRKTGEDKASLVNDTSLLSIRDYLINTDKIGLMHNENDPILQAGEIDQIKSLFPGRAMVYPTGGHCGNMEYRDNVEYMVNYFKTGSDNTATVASINNGSMK